jgi:ribose transport system substrate-binding protein
MLRRTAAVGTLILWMCVGCGPSSSSQPAANGSGADSKGANSSTPSAQSGKKYRIAVIPKGTGHQFWKSVEAGVRRAEKEFACEATFKGPTGEGDAADQIKIVENFLADGYDGICLAPLDAIALRKPVEQAIAAKTPVVIFDSDLRNRDGIVSYVATNNERGGQRAGEYLAKILGDKGKVILMRYDSNSASTVAREKGFVDALGKDKGITLISEDKHSGPNEADALELGEKLLGEFGAQADGVFCPNESTASGMLTALERDPKHLAGKVKFVGFDSSDHLVAGLKAGHLQGLILQDPVKMGYESVRVMVEKLNGHDVPARVEIPEALATTENMADPAIDKLLHPEVAK